MKNRVFTVIKMFAFAMTEFGNEFDSDKFEVQFFDMRDEFIESIEGDRKSVELFYGMLMEKGVSESNVLVLYCLKKFHLFRKKMRRFKRVG